MSRKVSPLASSEAAPSRALRSPHIVKTVPMLPKSLTLEPRQEELHPRQSTIDIDPENAHLSAFLEKSLILAGT